MDYNLNNEQMSAVVSTDKRILCLAGAGTGKTYTMLARISHLINHGVNPCNILVLTFTNAAAFEMKSRYIKDNSNNVVPEFRTFHSFCYHVLSTNKTILRSLGYSRIPVIADDNQRKNLYREAQNITGIKSSIASLSRKKHKSKEDEFNYSVLNKTVHKLMKKENLITFDTLCEEICKLFHEDSPLIQSYKDRYTYIFVDEFQDTDIIQYRFVDSFYNSHLFVVGDALQAIYAFRGADSSIIKELSTNPGWKVIKMYRNYRSAISICEFANKHSRHADDNYRVNVQSFKSEQGDVVCNTHSLTSSYGTIDSTSIDYCIQDLNHVKGDIAILCRTNKEVDYLKNYMDQHSITYTTGKQSEDIMHVLKSTKDNNYFFEWLTSCLNSDQYATYLRLSALEETTSYGLKAFLRDFGQVYSISSRCKLVNHARKLCKDTANSIFDRCMNLLEFLDCKNLVLDKSKCTSMTESINHILNVYDSGEVNSNSEIYIGTIHSVKGLEFDNVYVLGVDGPTFKLSDEENKNLYYVAITRAKQHLVVFERGI